MTVRVPVIKVVSITHPLRDLTQQSSLCFREMWNQGETVMSIHYSVHEERSNFGKRFEIFEGVQEFHSLSCPEHMFTSKVADHFFLILLIFILIALGYHSNKALKGMIWYYWLINEVNLEDLLWYYCLNWKRNSWLGTGCSLCLFNLLEFRLLLLECKWIYSEWKHQCTRAVNWIKQPVDVFRSRWVPIGFTIHFYAVKAGLDIELSLTRQCRLICDP